MMLTFILLQVLHNICAVRELQDAEASRRATKRISITALMKSSLFLTVNGKEYASTSTVSRPLLLAEAFRLQMLTQGTANSESRKVVEQTRPRLCTDGLATKATCGLPGAVGHR
jgi:hypothetical protein